MNTSEINKIENFCIKYGKKLWMHLFFILLFLLSFFTIILSCFHKLSDPRFIENILQLIGIVATSIAGLRVVGNFKSGGKERV